MLVIIGALFTALLSGVFAALATYSMNSNKEHVFFLRTKAEDLYIYFEKYCSSLSSYVFLHYPFMKGETSESDLLNHTIEVNKNGADTESHKHTNMIVSIYFPQLSPHLKVVMSSLEGVNSSIFKAKRLARSNNGKLRFDKNAFTEFDRQVTQLHEAQDKFKIELVRLAHNRANAEALSPPIIAYFKKRVSDNRSISPDGPI